MSKQYVNIPKIVVLHCADSDDYKKDDKKFDSIGLKEITEWHKVRGFKTCGYHHVVRQSGVIELGRPYEVLGAHTLGFNTNSIGICWVGRKYPTEKQVISLINLYILIYKAYRIRWTEWFGHYEYDAYKTCPNFSMNVFRKLLECYHQLMIKD